MTSATERTKPRWSPATKRTAVSALLVLLGIVLYRFRGFLPPLAIAFLIAFVLDPVARFVSARLGVSRGAATGLIFVVLVLALLGVLAAPVAVVPSIQDAVAAVQIDITAVIEDIGAFFDKPVEIGGYELDLSSVYAELASMLRSFVTSVAQGTLDVAFGVASGAFWTVFVLMTAFYLVKDADRIISRLDGLAPPGYRDDMVRLRRQITLVWRSFLVGQSMLALAMGGMTTVVCAAVGLPYAAPLGVLAALMEFVPNIGPFVAGVPAVLLALFQGSSFIPLSNFWFGVLVTAAYLLMQQVENNLLVPRILGRSLNLHPLLVLIGVVIGGSFAGILGMLLAAPALATLRVLAHYVASRLYDQDPFVELEKRPEPRRVSGLALAWQKRVAGLRGRWIRPKVASEGNRRMPPDDTVSRPD
jgi:predicted PurR-regulated permease PerM